MTETSKVALAMAGRERIEWAARSMPALHAAIARLAEQASIAGMRIGISLVLEPKTANLIIGLLNAKALVTVYAPSDCTDAEVIAALEERGVEVFSDPAADAEENFELARALLRTLPQILVDDGASVTRLAHREFPKILESMIGATEETTSGVRPLRVMHDQGQLKIPVIAVNDSPLKYLFDNVYGTGQSCVMALLDLTNLQIAGRKVLVIGYGWVGKGVARHAAALGALVTVAEIDPIKALQAQHDGHRVCAIEAAAGDCEVVFAATGIAGALTPEHLAAMPSGVILCTAGGGDFELPMNFLRSQSEPRNLRDHIDEYELADGRKVIVVADGHCINCTGGEGNPIEIMDLSLALQACAIETLANQSETLAPGVHPIAQDVQTQIAQERLTAAGASTEPLTQALKAALVDW